LIRILIVDDHEIVREGIRTLLSRSRPDWKICGEASNGEEAIQLTAEMKPDVVVLDVTMPVMSGIDAAPQIVRAHPDCRVLIFTMHDSDRFIAEVQRIGARGFVLKSQASRDLVRAIEEIVAGEMFFSSPPDVPKRNTNRLSAEGARSLDASARPASS